MQNSNIKIANLVNQFIATNDDANNDSIYVENSIVDTHTITGMETRKGLEKVVISGGKIVNIVSNQYGHLPNNVFFKEVESKLAEANIGYLKRVVNRENCSFSVDYILNDNTLLIKAKNETDIMLPMLRFINSYDGSNKTKGSFGIYRQICTNGLFGFRSEIGFAVKHRGNIASVVMPKIGDLVTKFIDNEYYTLSRKFEVLAETFVTDLTGFVKLTTETLGLFKYEMSDKNPMPSLNARMVLDIINKESNILGTPPSLWNVYNAVNEVIHSKLKKSFDKQIDLDAKLFDFIMLQVA